ncbi:MAG TPA: SIS domain-containing protein [Polyangiaceae bacterium]|nr:SIS domain-containing protein [Polyangiaceae bacterium]
MQPQNQFEREILEQPRVLQQLLNEGRQAAEEAAIAIKKFGPEFVLIAARGSSDNAARYAQYLLGAHNRLAVALAVPSLFTLYDSPPNLQRALAIGISQSGQSPDIVGVLEETRKQGGATLAVTNEVASPLSRVSDHTLPLLAGQEKAVAATKTYTTELLALAMLSAALEGDKERWAALERVPAWVNEVIEKNANLTDQAARFEGAQKLVVLGRGFNYSTAFEIALKLKETSYLVAEPYSVADLLHGPVAMIDRGFRVILVAPSGRTQADLPHLLSLLENRGAELLAISDLPEVLARAQSRIELPAGVPEWLSPIVAVVPGQLFAGALAVSSGQNPDQPRGLSKVTMTR